MAQHTKAEFEGLNRTMFLVNIDSSLKEINTSDRMAYRDVFERALRCAKRNVKLAASYGFKSDTLITGMIDAINILSKDNQQNSRDAIYMFEDALMCIDSAKQELLTQHRRRIGELREHLEAEKFSDANDIAFVEATMELEKYTAEYSSCVHDIIDAYEKVFKIIGTDKVWISIIDKIIADVTDFAKNAYTVFVLSDGREYRVTGVDRVAELLTKWEDKQTEVKRRIEIELERERREAAERAERERREAEIRAEQERREAEARAERERREAEERARIQAAEEAEKIRVENERLEREYSEFVVNTNIKIDKMTEERAVVQAEYEEFQQAVGSKLAELAEDEKYRDTLFKSKKELTDKIERLREENTEKAAAFAQLGVFANAEKKNLKLDMDRISNEISDTEQKLESYNREITNVERRIHSKDAGGKAKLEEYIKKLEDFDNQMQQLRKEIEDKKPFHMRNN